MDIEKIATKARGSISSFCMNECHAYCCRKGHLPLTEKQKKNFSKHMTPQEAKKRIKPSKTGYSYALEGNCTFLDHKNFGCTIHKSTKKPKTCSDFPMYVRGKDVYVSPQCTAVKEGKLYEFISRLKNEGAEIISGAPPSTFKDVKLTPITLK